MISSSISINIIIKLLYINTSTSTNNGNANANINGNHNTTNITNNTNNININIAGQESLEHIKETKMMYYIRNILSSFLEFLEEKYSNEENLNIYIHNINSNIVKVFTSDNEFKYKNFNDIIEKIIDKDLYKLYTIFEDEMAELQKCCSNVQLNNFKNYYTSWNNKAHKKHKTTRNKLIEYYKIEFLNNREHVKKIMDEFNLSN